MTLVIGMFKSGYGSDMGRQVIPVLLMASLWLAVAVRERRLPAFRLGLKG